MVDRAKLKRIERHIQSCQQNNEQDFSQYINHPVEFALEALKVKILTNDQKNILTSVRDNPETNVPSHHGAGKTITAAILILWWVFSVKGLAISTAPTARQVRELLWGEIRQLYQANKDFMKAEVGQLFLRVSETSRAYGFSSKDYDSNSFQGIHHPKLLIIQDEACGISLAVDDGTISCATGTDNRILRIGNPISPSTAFESACKRKSMRIAAWSHPNVSWAYSQDTDGVHRLKPEIAEKIFDENGYVKPQFEWASSLPRDVIPGAISIAWIERMRKEKGEGSPFWQSRVEGWFPRDSVDSIIPRSWFVAARNRYDENPTYWDNLAASQSWRHGFDVGDGGDEHAWALWRGSVLYNVQSFFTKGDMQDISRAIEIASNKLQQYPGVISVDRVGVGAGVASGLLDMGISVIGIHWGSAADDSQYQNLKIQQFWEMREAFRKGELAIAPLGDIEEILMEDLAGIFYDESSTGRLRIEDKAITKKRLRRSPNAADAMVMAFHASQKQSSSEFIPTFTTVRPKYRFRNN